MPIKIIIKNLNLLECIKQVTKILLSKDENSISLGTVIMVKIIIDYLQIILK